ncbi:MAG: trypsin-like peptidase domain-containing protein [Gammaproteobacteria bacterium]|nr:trypsin-like peptidase domain-containing protein [Gammaproteobacteria bacterium]
MLHYKKNTLLCFFISFLLLGVSTIVNADHTYKTSIVKKVLPAVVEIHAEKGNVSAGMQPQERGGFKFREPQGQQPQGRKNPKQDPQHVGSGFVISADGYVLTNAHVINNIIDGGKVIVIFKNDKSYEADLVNYDEDSDIALLKINNAEHDKVFEYLEWGETPELGQDVIAIGSPMGQSFSITFGNVSSLNRFIPRSAPFVPYIQTDAAINPGNSGGPLLDSHGHVVGINTIIITGGSSRGSIGLGFAIDGDYVQKTVEQLKALPEGQRITRPYMGIIFRPTKKEDYGKLEHLYEFGNGAYVQEVVPGSPVEGVLKVGDIINRLDGKSIKWKMLATKVKSKKIGDETYLIVIRDGMLVPITITMQPMK